MDTKSNTCAACFNPISFALLLVLLVLTTGCRPDTSTEALKVGISKWPPNEMAHLALDLGLFGNAKISLIEEVMPAEYMPTIANGTYDLIAVSLGSAAHVLSINDNYRVVMLVSYSNGSDALVAHPEFHALADLAGKRVGYEPLALGTYLLNRFLASANMTTADIVPVPVDGLNQIEAFRSGSVDAIVTYEPDLSSLVSDGARVLKDSSALPSEIMDVMLAEKSVLENKRALLQTFVDGWFEALAYHETNLVSAAEYSESRSHFSKQQYLEAFEGVVMLSRQDNVELLEPGNSTLESIMDMHMTFLQQVGLTQSAFRLSDVVDRTLVSEPDSSY